MVKSKFSWEERNGVKVLKISNHTLMAPGFWSGINGDNFFESDELIKAYDLTDWNDIQNRYLLFEHNEKANQFIGVIENPIMVGSELKGDILVSDEDAQKSLLLGAKFGISPKFNGLDDPYTKKAYALEYKNFSLVFTPACKKTFINSEGEHKEIECKEWDEAYKNELPDSAFAYIDSEGGRHLPFKNKEGKPDLSHIQNALARVNQVKGMTPEKESEIRSKLEKLLKPSIELSEIETGTDTLFNSESMKSETIDVVNVVDEVESKKIGDIMTEEIKVEASPLVETKVEAKVEARDYDELTMYNHFMERMAKTDAIKGEYAEFAKKFKEENPKATFDSMNKAYQGERKFVEMENSMTEKFEKKLAELEKGQKLSAKVENTPVANADVDAGMVDFLKEMHNNGKNSATFMLSYSPKMSRSGLKTFELGVATQNSSVYGTAVSSVYTLNPMMYVKNAVDAAKERLMFLQLVGEQEIPEGMAHAIFPYRKKYLANSSWSTSTAEYDAASEISWTAINTLDGVQATPTRYNYGVALSNDAIRKNLLPLVQECRNELSYKYENSIDTAIITALLGNVDTTDASSLGATEMTNSVNGCQTIFGGDATDADSSLDATDVLTTDMVRKARMMLMSTAGFYWTGNTLTKSAVTKNPWTPTPAQPFVLMLAPEQAQALLAESQFTNASEYGSGDVVLNGEIGKYLGVKVVETTKCPAIAASSEIYCQATQTTLDVAGHLCGMVKAGVCGGIAYGQRPDITVFDYPSADQVRMKLSMSYAVAPIHSDAIVRMVVTDA